MARRLKKHRSALIALALLNFTLFFPVLFMGRVVSPNDVYNHYSPWREARDGVRIAQNAVVNDPPTSYLTLISLVRDNPDTFHWNPYVAAGIPGFGSSAAAVLSPFILLPALLVPLVWVYTAILFLKMNAAFLFAYGWLREEGFARGAPAVGATIAAAAGVYSVHWLWQVTNATVLYTALLWIACRVVKGRRTPIALMAVVALSFALAGFPSTMAYGAWLVLLYVAIGLLRRRRLPVRELGAATFAVGIALLIALPSLVPFAQFLKRTGYLEVRESTSLQGVYPASHWRSFVDPDYLGHPVYKNWIGEGRSRTTANYVAATSYVGWLTIPLAVAGLFNRRARFRFFWAGGAGLLLACMFGMPLIAPFIAELPGVKYSSLTRLGLLLPLPAAYLASAGASLFRWKREAVASIAAIVLAVDLGVFAGRFHPYLEHHEAGIPSTEVTAFLRAQPGPFRIAPFFDFLWPNSAELERVEDVRSHFGSEAIYRRMLQRLDPTSWSGRSTVVTFNSLHFDFADPLAGLLGVRWYVEQLPIDIVKWRTFDATVPVGRQVAPLALNPGDLLERTIVIDHDSFWAIELPVHIGETVGNSPRLTVELWREATKLWSRDFRKEDLDVMNRAYVPVRPFAAPGDQVILRLISRGMRGSMLEGEGGGGGSAFYYGRVTTPVIFDRQLAEGRLFRNLSEVPRFRVAERIRKLNVDEFLAVKTIDFSRETVITDDPVQVPEGLTSDASVRLLSYLPDGQRLATEAAGAFLLASTEKLTPELRVTIGGRTVEAIQVDGLFAGVVVPAGRQEIVFSRRLARGWWWVAIAGVLLWLMVAAAESWRLLQRKRKQSSPRPV